MSKHTTQDKKERQTLKELYFIKGDGVATLNVAALRSDPVFKDRIKKLSTLELKTHQKENNNTLANHG